MKKTIISLALAIATFGFSTHGFAMPPKCERVIKADGTVVCKQKVPNRSDYPGGQLPPSAGSSQEPPEQQEPQESQ